MRLSRKSKITFQVLLDIAAHTAVGRAISIPHICRRHLLSHSYIEQIFTQLKLVGMIRSHRGPGGGYSLAQEPRDISLYGVVCLLDGKESVREDLAAALWTGLEQHMNLQMQKITLFEALQRSTIVIEQSTKGISFPDLAVVPRVSAQVKPKKEIKRRKPRLGPNSVFAFGSYLKLTR
jgi:Rrf2 family iron-sulfur cluster assembly transcriptional regulator